MKLRAEAMEFRASLPTYNPESSKFSLNSVADMTEAELHAEKSSKIVSDWRRLLTGGAPVIKGRRYDDIINLDLDDYDDRACRD